MWNDSGSHNFGLYSLNYDIDYTYTTALNNYNGLNALAYGYQYENYKLNKITPNGLSFGKLIELYYYIFNSFNTFTMCNYYCNIDYL